MAGIEIENSRNAIVHGNLTTRNTGGILVFDLPNLPVMGGGNTVVENNLVIDNDTPNFAPKGNIVAGVPRGTGVMVMANETVVVRGNTLANNPTAQIMVLAYPNAFDDPRYNPLPRRIVIGANTIIGGGNDPQLPGGDQLKAVFGGALPPVLWDGLGGAGALVAGQKITGLSLNLPAQGASPDQARPAPFELAAATILPIADGVGAPAALEARIAR